MSSKCDFNDGSCDKDVGTLIPFFCDTHAQHIMDLNKRTQAEKPVRRIFQQCRSITYWTYNL